MNNYSCYKKNQERRKEPLNVGKIYACPLKLLALVILSALGHPQTAVADEALHFDPRMLGVGGSDASQLKNVDLDYFSKKGGQSPGTYLVDIWFNGEFQETRSLQFVDSKNSTGELRAVLTPAMLRDIGIHLPQTMDGIAADETLPESVAYYIPSAKEQLDVGKLRWELSVPQAQLDTRAQGSVDPALWDEGITALLLNYTYSGSTTEDREDDSRQRDNFLGLHAGMNWQAWRLRYDGSLTQSHGDQNESDDDSQDNTVDDNENGTHWDSINTYVQRDVRFWQGGQLTFGQYSTPSSVFDSVQFTGAQLASDDDMLPDSMSQYAPVIRGIAKSNSQVTIRQNGSVIYQTYVPAGPFAIKDIYSTGGGGDLQVSVKGSDGNVTQFSVPFTSLDVLQREGRIKYSMTGGKYRSGNDDTETPNFVQGTISAGIPWDLTLYGGIQYADTYHSAGMGIGKNMGYLGALAFDITRATADFRDSDTRDGTAYRAQYEKTLELTSTDFRLAGYHYTEAYYSFGDAQDYYSDSGSDLDIFNRTHVKKNRIQATLNQPFGSVGSLSFSGSQANYWNESGKERNWQASWSGALVGVSYSLSYGYTRNPGEDEADQTIALNLSVPLSMLMNNNSNAWMNYSMNSSKNGNTANQVGISGSALADNNLNYSVSQGYGSHGSGSLGNANLEYKGAYGKANAGYSYDNDSRQVNYGGSGGMVIHGDGVTFSQFMDQTVALVKAPGASNVRVVNNNGVKTDWRGYTIVPYLQPYRRGRVELDTTTFGNDVDMERTIDKVVPTKGAIVLADFETHLGQRALINLTNNGQPVPFGAVVTLNKEQGSGNGIVGDKGQVYITGLPDSGDLLVQWGEKTNCHAHYTLPSATEHSGAGSVVPEISAMCN